MSFSVLNVYNESLKISKQLIEELKQKIIEKFDKNPDLYYNTDIENIKKNDWSVRRFLFNYKKDPDINKALESMDKTLKWRKGFGVLEINKNDFPKEVYMSAGIIKCGKDCNGAQVILLRGKVAKKFKSWFENGQKFLVCLIERIDNENEGKGLTILMDCRDAGVKNANIDALKFMNQLFNEYYPGLVNSGLIYKMPAVLEAIYKMVRTWLNEEQVKYCYLIDMKTINNYVAADQLPDLIMGSLSCNYREVPEGAPDAHHLAERLGIKPEKADKLVKHLQKFYDN